ncbi:MAG: hypothetical protein O3B00_08530 [archaeon]|nr:hypothetical protein [archaeon]
MLSNKTIANLETITTKDSNSKKRATEPEKTHFFDGFTVSPKQYSEVCLYSCDARSYDTNDFKTRLDISRNLKRNNTELKTTVFKRYIATNISLTQDEIEANNLNSVNNPSEYQINGAKKQLIENDFKYGWNHPQFSNLKSKLPILSLNVFNQYLQYNPRVYHFQGRFILRPNPSMSYSRSDTCHDLLQAQELSIGSNLKYVYKSGSCVLRNITSRTISDVDPTLGISLLEFYRSDMKFAPFMKSIEENPNMIVLEIDHDRFNQGQNTTIYSIAACLLTPDIRLDDIPEQYRKRFMINSHVDMNARFERCEKYLDGLNEDKLMQLLPHPVDISLLGMKVLKVQANRLLFGDGYTTNDFSAYGNFKSLVTHKVFKAPKGVQTIGIIPYGGNSECLNTFSNKIKVELNSIGIDCNLQTLSPYNLDVHGRLNQFELAEKYGSINVDCVLVELPNYSDNWVTWKNALTSIPSQMITTKKMRSPGVSFNTTLGLASCLGSMPIGLDGNLTGIQAWIGMDVYSDGKKHIAAASTVCDAGGMLIGYPPSAVCSGERLDDAAFERMMRIIMDGISHHYAKEGRPIPIKLGLIRDGQFFENPQVITKIEKEYEVSFVVVEVKKQGSPKLAVEDGVKYASAECGTLICGLKGGYIQTTGDGSGQIPGTPILREVRLIRGDVEVGDLLEDIFWLSKIHGGSTRQPGLPIPQTYSHKLAERAGLGVHIPNTFNTDMSFL